MRLGLIARADDGGLGTLTQEFARNLNVERALIVDLGHKSRGETHVGRIKDVVADARVINYPFGDEALRWLVDGLDVVYTAETPYNVNLYGIACESGCRVVLHAMPELLKPDYKAHEVWLPTTWCVDEIPHTRVIPIPVALERFEFRERTEVNTMLHVPGEAMLDRNGTDLLMSALPMVSAPLVLVVAGVRMRPRKVGNVTVVGREASREYWENYTDDIDLLVLPRRYGGLCLPVQEAAACGIPSLMLGVEPQTGWPGFRVPAVREDVAKMAGGNFDVHGCSPATLAEELNRVCSLDISYASNAAHEWAQQLGWARWRDVYQKSLTPFRSV